MSLFDSLPDFTSIHWWLDALDILIVVFLVYQIFKFVRGTAAIRIFIGAVAIYTIWQLTEFLEMELLHEILGQFIGVGVIALIVVFQQEIRRFLLLIASPKFYNRFMLTKWMFKLRKSAEHEEEAYVESVVRACENMAKSKTGALIVISAKGELETYKSTGVVINANFSADLLESIFLKDGPLHDGAVLISQDRILAARCVLPVSERQDLPGQLGLRHRAAIGVTEQTDTVAVVVSEQNGRISVCREGKITNNVSIKRLPELISSRRD